MCAVRQSQYSKDFQKPMIVFIGFSTTSFKIYCTTLAGNFPDFVSHAAPNISAIWEELPGRDIGLIIAGHDHCSDLMSMDEALKTDYPSASLCVAYDGKAGLSQCHHDIVRNHQRFSLLAMDIRLDVWIAAISLMLSGGRYVQPELMVTPSTRSSKSTIDAVSNHAGGDVIGKLTPREQEVLALVADGLQNKIIADRLKLSEHTIKLHMHHIFSKLDVTNRTQAAALYRRPPEQDAR